MCLFLSRDDVRRLHDVVFILCWEMTSAGPMMACLFSLGDDVPFPKQSLPYTVYLVARKIAHPHPGTRFRAGFLPNNLYTENAGFGDELVEAFP